MRVEERQKRREERKLEHVLFGRLEASQEDQEDVIVIENDKNGKTKSKRKRLLDSEDEAEEEEEEKEEEEEEEAQDKLRVIQILSKCEEFSSRIKNKIDTWHVSIEDTSSLSTPHSKEAMSSFVSREEMQRCIHPDVQVFFSLSSFFFFFFLFIVIVILLA